MNLKPGLKTILKALVAAALIAGILTGCGAKPVEMISEELTAADAYASAQAEEAEGLVEEMSVEEELSGEETDEEAEKTESEDFPGYFWRILAYSYLCDYTISYNDKTKNNLTFALENIESSIWHYSFYEYNWPESCWEHVSRFCDSDPADPLHQFDLCNYNRYDAEKVDWLLINIFNVKPDHSYNSKQHSSAKLNDDFNCYYYQGYYYAAEYYKTSRAELPETKIEAWTQKENGDYEFTVCGYENLDGKKIFTCKLTAQKNRIDGREVWKLISIEEKTTPSLQEARDNDLFYNLFWEIAFYSYLNNYKIVYNANTKNNLTFALENINNVWSDVWNCCAEQYNWPSGCVRCYAREYNEKTEEYAFKEPDPLGKITSTYYDRLDGDKVDWILINIFNVKPDHSYDSDRYKSAKLNDGFDCYYYKGYYYYSDGDGGEAAPEFKINSKTKNSSGDYVFKLTGYDDPFEKYKNYNYTVVARKTKVDGQSVWKLISIEETYTPFTEEEQATMDFIKLFTTVASFRSKYNVSADYGVNSADKLMYALNYVSGNDSYDGLWSYCNTRFNWPTSAYKIYNDGFTDEPGRDPLKQFGEEERYLRLDGEKVDWILKNILNVTPDHSFNTKNSKSDDSELIFDCYYHKGNYYFKTCSGDSGISYFYLDSKTKTGSNEYEFQVSGNDPNTGVKAVAYTVTAQLNTVDGQKVWKLISFYQYDPVSR